MTSPLAFAEQCLGLEGALVERQGTALEAVLPPPLALALGLPEHAVLTEELRPDAQHLGYGTHLLERLLHLATARLPVAGAKAVAPPIRATQATDAAQGFVLRNGVSSVGAVRPLAARRLWVNAVWKARTDEDREGVASAVVSLGTGTPVAGFEEAVTLEPSRGGGRVAPSEGRRALTAALRRCGELGEAHTGVFREASARRLARDQARMEGYFAELLAELGRRGARGKAEDAAVRDKRQAIERERAAKLEALVARSTFRLEARPISVALVEAAAYAVPVTLRRRKESREVTLEYDCATRSLVPFACEACSRPAPRPAVCDGALHLLCETCAPSAQGRLDCSVCLGR